MGISNTIPPSRLIQPGVCTSSTRPTSPFEGQAIYETDTDLMLIWNGTAWVVPNTTAQTFAPGGTATSFTPTWSNYTRGNGTTSSYYTLVNKLVYVYVKETLGSTSSMGTGPTLTLPFAAPRTEAIPVSRWRIDDTGANVFWGTIAPVSATAVTLYADVASGTYVSFSPITATVPMTWTTGDIMSFSFVYEAA